MNETLTRRDAPKMLSAWLDRNGNPHTEQRGHRLAVCTQGLLISETAKLYDLIDYIVTAVCGPYTELTKRETDKDRAGAIGMCAELGID